MLAASLFVLGSATAHEDGRGRKFLKTMRQIHLAQTVVPKAEEGATQEVELEGPKQQVGIEKSRLLGGRFQTEARLYCYKLNNVGSI